MPTPPASGSHDRLPLEPIRVLRPRRTDALAELFKEMEQGTDAPGPVAVPDPRSWDEGETQELPPVRTGHSGAPRGGDRFGFGPGLRRAAVTIAVAAAALIGFGGALLLHHRNEAAAVPAPHPTATAEPTPTAEPTATASAASDPDGPGTLREGDSGPAVTDLQQRLLRIPDVYAGGSTGGTYDATLKAAVARFQLWYGIRGDETGVYGNDTRVALESRTASGTG